MSRRDALFKATAKALSPDAFDLSQYRQRGIREREVRAGRDSIAGAMGMASSDWKEDKDDTELKPGDPLAVALLRLKIMPHDRHAFDAAHALLMRRYVRRERRRRQVSEIMFAVATVALFEWLFDECPDCRNVRVRPTVKACPQCVGGMRERGGLERAERRAAFLTGALPGEVWAPRRWPCTSCDGYGRILRKERRSKGMGCAKCGNSGRVHFTLFERYVQVQDLLQIGLLTKQRVRRQRAVTADSRVVGSGFTREAESYTLTHEIFRRRWMPKYGWFLDLLRKLDKKLTHAIDIQLTRDQNSAIVRELEEKDMLEDERDGAREDDPDA